MEKELTIKEKLNQINEWIVANENAIKQAGISLVYMAADMEDEKNFYGFMTLRGAPSDAIAMAVKLMDETIREMKDPWFRDAVKDCLLDYAVGLKGKV